jgi:hypothetical protein
MVRMPGITITLRVTAPDRSVARVAVRRHQFSIGRPLELDISSPRIAALEYALGAVGAEVVNGLREFAERRRADVDAVEAIVTGELENGLTYLEVIGEHGEPRISAIAIKVFVSSADEAVTRAVFDDMLHRLPLLCTLRAAVRITAELIFTS